MTSIPSKSRTRRRIRLLAPILLVTVLALVVWMMATVSAHYAPTANIVLDDYTSGANADVTSEFNIALGDVFFDSIITFTPPEWGVATDAQVPDGTEVGVLTTLVGLGILSNPCSGPLNVSFDLVDATVDRTTEFADSGDIGTGTWNGFDQIGGLDRAITQWPEFLSTLFPGATLRARYYGHNPSIAGSHVILNFLVLEPDPDILDHPSFSADWGYGSLTVLNDPTTPAAPSPITDNCSPVESNNTIFGLVDDIAVRTNPPAGTYVFRSWSRGTRDNDGDGYENGIDTCPWNVNLDGDPRSASVLNPDQDGIDSACDPDPVGVCGLGADDDGDPIDCDSDGFANRGDNCPFFVDSPFDPQGARQIDTDNDGKGDRCDPDPTTPFGDDSRPVETTEMEVEITQSATEQTATPTPTPTATAAGTGTATATGTPTPEGTTTPTAVAGEGCAPVIPGTYNGLVRLNGVPAAAGYEVTAVIDGTEWGTAIVSGGRYALDVPQKLPSSEPCFAGGTITFKINGATCEPTEDWASGLHDVDLSCAPVATPTPPVVGPTTPPGTPPVTPVVTPAKPPVTGSGGLGGDQGLPLWAMIIAGWASLTVLAGLGTFATRIIKR